MPFIRHAACFIPAPSNFLAATHTRARVKTMFRALSRKRKARGGAKGEGEGEVREKQAGILKLSGVLS